MDRLRIAHDTHYGNLQNTMTALQVSDMFDRCTQPTAFISSFQVVYENDPYILFQQLMKERDYSLVLSSSHRYEEHHLLYPMTGVVDHFIEICTTKTDTMADLRIRINASDHTILQVVKDKILQLAGNSANVNYAKVTWYYSEDNHFEHQSIFEDLSDTFYYQAYPNHPNLKERVQDYIKSKTPVILVKGQPGTGKTRLVREIIRQYGKHYEKMPKVAYTTSQVILENDQFFIEFMAGDKDILLLEDIDFNLSNREQGNTIMPNFLNTSDGFIQLKNNKKIIFTTNILKTDKIDQALIRAGRCFDVLSIGLVSDKQAQSFYEFLGGTDKLPSGTQTIADIFAYHNGDRKYEKQLDRKVGFGR
jgi:hypothetical protein